MSDAKIVVNFDRFADVIARAPSAAENAIDALAHECRNYAVMSIQDRSSGETYYRYSPKRLVTASAPGDAPNTDTGNLVNSIQVERAGTLRRLVNVGAEYGLPLELGAPGRNIAARPFMGPAAMHTEKVAPEFFRDFIT
jgi:hypothetical protein